MSSITATNPLHLLNAHQNLPPPPPSTLRAGVPVGMDEVVAKALAKNIVTTQEAEIGQMKQMLGG